MAQKFASGIAELLHRAEKDTTVTSKPKSGKPVPVLPAEKERRHIYGGNDPQSITPGYAVRPANKKVIPAARRSTFNMIALLFFSAIGIVAYISNILTVNQLAVDVHRLQTQYEKITNTNSVLESEINKKSAWERIGSSAIEHGLKYAKERPTSFDVDESKLNKFKNK
ncbi:MAG: hypothetical protein ABI623_00270 [bacterium]